VAFGAGSRHRAAPAQSRLIVVPLTYGRVKVVSAAGEAIAEMQAGAAYARKAGVEHDVVNAGDAPLSFVEIELKRRPG
jgi:beta-alanine degradation protein BauB